MLIFLGQYCFMRACFNVHVITVNKCAHFLLPMIRATREANDYRIYFLAEKHPEPIIL